MAAITFKGFDPGESGGGRRRPPRGGRGQDTGYTPDTGMPGTENNPNTGYPGPTAPPEAPKPAPNWGTLNAGFDRGKLDNAAHKTFKYDFARTVAPFDPRKGFTPEVLAALNALGYADFYSPGGDKLGMRNVTAQGRAAEMDPNDFFGDFIQGFDAQGSGTQWQYDWNDYGQTPEQGAYGPALPRGSAPQGFNNPPEYYYGGQQMPSIFSDQNFWQQLMQAMQPQTPQGYSNAPMPSFGGAYSPARQQPVPQQNPQIAQLLTQLFAGLGGR